MIQKQGFFRAPLIAVALGLAACSPAPDESASPAEAAIPPASELPAYQNPIVPQGADPWIHRTEAGRYYFIATAPEFDRIELRAADTINGLREAESRVIWRPHETSAMSPHIWAPELHHIDGVWYIHVAAGKEDQPFHIRMYVLSNPAEDPMTGTWKEEGQIQTPWDSFSLDATSFEHRGTRYLVWAQRDREGKFGSALYMAEQPTPTSIREPVITLSEPVLPWEVIGHKVNEGAAVIKRHGRVFITYSASATDHNYAMGLLWADADADLMDPASWHKSPEPVFYTHEALERFGPGHNSFTLAEDGKTDLLVYHARSYRELRGTPLTDPNRDARVRVLRWTEEGFPDFGQDLPD